MHGQHRRAGRNSPWNAEGTGLGNWFAQHIDQRVVDARVLDASGSEQKFHEIFPLPM